ncbi:MAG: hypothetical protein KDC88_06035 [Ignavibacteriae bacterium]|nr:hypothetical protein [Ignavibacteriota bacterium]
MNKIVIKIFTLISVILLCVSCLEDTNSPEDFTFYNSADLVSYFEVNGDFINSSANPALISVDDVNDNFSKYLLLDIRKQSEFELGHIAGAVNLEIKDLIKTIEDNGSSTVEKIIIISEDGQKAAYAASLLRLYGINNVYSLDFGMGYWNHQFSQIWLDARNDSRYKSQLHLQANSKSLKTKQLPIIEFSDPSLSMDMLAKARIQSLLTDNEYQKSVSTIEELEEFYHILNKVFENSYIICYGGENLYNIFQVNKNIVPGPLFYGGHPRTSAYYNMQNDFKSSENLLTLPLDKTIYVYSYNGQRSAYLVAYLRILGYNAKSILFGGVSMFYYYMKYDRFEECFSESKIKDYSFVN